MTRKMRIGYRPLAVTGLLLASQLMADDTAVGQAQAAYEAGRWQEAAQAFEALSGSMPDSPGVWFRLGVSRRHLGDTEGAMFALQQARAAGAPESFVKSEIARVLADSGDTGPAMAMLEEAVLAGYQDLEALRSDPGLDSLRTQPGYPAIIAQAEARRYPCRDDPRYREFDFWLGTWEVFTVDGRRAGSNEISSAEAGCLLLESWKGASGGTGTSMNFFDASANQWVQVWVSGDGTLIDIRGGLSEGSMVLVGTIRDRANPDGAPFRGTWTLLEDGRVRQFFEQAAPDGSDWTPWFEGFYLRQPQP